MAIRFNTLEEYDVAFRKAGSYKRQVEITNIILRDYPVIKWLSQLKDYQKQTAMSALHMIGSGLNSDEIRKRLSPTQNRDVKGDGHEKMHFSVY